MIKLHDLKQRHGLNTLIEVYYHRYLDNLEEGADAPVQRAPGFQFLHRLLGDDAAGKTFAIVEDDASVTDTDRETLKRLALPPYADLVNLVKQYPKQACTLKDDWLVLDCNGNTVLCCTIFNQAEYSVGKYLDMPVQELMSRKSTQKNCVDLCNRCAKNGSAHLLRIAQQGAAGKSCGQSHHRLSTTHDSRTADR